jgi:uncharacterized small protein (DUF1192 family)
MNWRLLPLTPSTVSVTPGTTTGEVERLEAELAAARSPQGEDREAVRLREALHGLADAVNAQFERGEAKFSGTVLEALRVADETLSSAPERVLNWNWPSAPPDGFCPVCGGETEHYRACRIGVLEAEVARLSSPSRDGTVAVDQPEPDALGGLPPSQPKEDQ